MNPTLSSTTISNIGIFSICAMNYIGLAEVMLLSAKENNPDIDLHLFVIDVESIEFDRLEEINYHAAQNVLANYYVEPTYAELAFAYNVTELATCIKASCFLYLFKSSDLDHLIYLDPDTFVYSSFDPIVKLLSVKSIVLTPHLLNSATSDLSPLHETFINTTGIFNLGFVGFSRTIVTNQILLWWHRRLQLYCLSETIDGQYTDQLWMNFIHSYWCSEEIGILRDPGCNIAPWNFHERYIVPSGTEFHVYLRQTTDSDHLEINDSSSSVHSKLIFAHFSGFDYSLLVKGCVRQKNISSPLYCDDAVHSLYNPYVSALESHNSRVSKFLACPYKYSTLENGAKITTFHRRLYYAHQINPDKKNYSIKLSPLEFVNLLASRKNMFQLSKPMMLKFGILSKTRKRLSSEPRLPYALKIILRLMFICLNDRNFFLLLRSMRFLSRPKRYTFLLD